MSFPKYEVYKDSGVEWLGEVPEHWETSKLKFLCKIQTGDKDTVNAIEDGEYPFFVRSQTIERINSFSHNCEAVLTAGDGVGVGKVFHYIEGAFDFHQRVYMLCNFQGVLGRFVFHYLKENFYKVALAGEAKSTVDSLRMPTFLNFIFTVPTLDEQTQIIQFIDYEADRIDALIAEQKRLIELLKEKRQAVISHAVTKGLDAIAPMKDSGVEWLGEVPAHWEVYLLRRAFRSVDYGISNSLEAEGDVAILRMGNIENGMIVKDELKYIDSVPIELILNDGDLLYNRTNSLDQIGKVGLFHDDGSDLRFSFASYLVRLRVNDESVSKYFAYLLNAPAILDLARASAFVSIGQCNLNPARYGYIVVAVPPHNEQAKIVEYLDRKILAIDELIIEANEGIQLFQERRSALISAAVTGKIDVRGWQAPASAAPAPTLVPLRGIKN